MEQPCGIFRGGSGVAGIHRMAMGPLAFGWVKRFTKESKIECRRATNVCWEAATEESPYDRRYIWTNLNWYSIVSWNKSRLVFEDKAECATTTYVVDLSMKDSKFFSPVHGEKTYTPVSQNSACQG